MLLYVIYDIIHIMAKKLYTPQEVAARLDVAYMTVYRWIQSGKLRAYQLEKQYRIDVKDLKNFIEKRETIKRLPISSSLSTFIDSEMMDYAYFANPEFPIDLFLGVNPLGCSDKVTTYYKKKDIYFTNMVDPTADQLREKIAAVYGFKKEEVLVGAGASDLLHLSYITFMNPQEDIVIPETTFPPLEFLAVLSHGNPQFIPFTKSIDLDYEKFESVITRNCKMVVLCNPNNPTGRQLHKEKTEKIIKKYPDIVFIIDEANIDFGGISFLDLTKKYPNLLIIRSFTKGFGLAGLRVGFIIGQKNLIFAMSRRQTPFSVNIFAQELAKIALEDLDFLEKTKQYIKKERKYLETELTKLGYSFITSDSNLFLVNISNKFSSSTEFIKKVNEKGANVVDGSNFRGLGNSFVRISIRLHETNKRFIDILKTL
jgi:histidinol-phosphate aminotransferase